MDEPTADARAAHYLAACDTPRDAAAEYLFGATLLAFDEAAEAVDALLAAPTLLRALTAAAAEPHSAARDGFVQCTTCCATAPWPDGTNVGLVWAVQHSRVTGHPNKYRHVDQPPDTTQENPR